MAKEKITGKEKMKIETYRNNNPNTKEESNPESIIEAAVNGFELVLEFIEETNPDIQEEYIKALRKNLQEDIEGYRFNSKVFDIDTITKNRFYKKFREGIANPKIWERK